MKERKIYLDVLRILSSFAVIVVHITSLKWHVISTTSSNWQALNFYCSLARFCVPVLFMISGALFLNQNKEISLKTLYKKYILRLVIAYLFWVCFYAFIPMILGSRELTLEVFLERILTPKFHLWFLPVLIGLYMLVPFLRSFVKNKKSVEYALVLFFIFGIVRFTLLQFDISEYLEYILNLIPLEAFTGYLGYFLLGYYLDHEELSLKNKQIIYMFGILGVAMCMFGTLFLSVTGERRIDSLYEYLSLTTFLASSAVFLLAKEYVPKIKWNEKSKKIILNISSYTFGIYLVHMALRDFLVELNINSITFPSFIWIPVYALISYLICLFAVFIMKKIPIVKKYLI